MPSFCYANLQGKERNMEFLEELFGGQQLTYAQLADAAQKRGLQVVDAAGGAYVPKADFDNLSGQLSTVRTQLGEANTKLEGFDPEWKTKAEAAQRTLDEKAFDFALDKALTGAKAKNATAVKALLDRAKLTMADGEVLGLDKQLEALKRGEDTAFLFEMSTPAKTGMSHQGGREETPNKNDEANAAIRAVFGKEN